MTFTITKTKFAIALVVVAMLVPATAMATHVFDDVPDDKFYADPVEWAFDNGITTGKSPTTFAPDDNVTRGESVTFLKRYNDNIVEPATTANANAAATNAAQITVLQSAVAALSSDNPRVSVMHYTGSSTDDSISVGWEKVRDLGSFTKADADTVALLSATGHGRVTGSFCHWQLRVDGVTDAGNTGASVSLADAANAVQFATGSYFIQGLFADLSAGAHTVELWVRGSATSCVNNDGNFGHDVFAIEMAAAD